MAEKNKASRALAHSGFDDGDYIFINPRQVFRVIKANKYFIFMCVVIGLTLAITHHSFVYVATYVSEAKLKIEPKSDSMNITPLFERFQQNEQLFTRTNAVLEEVQSSIFVDVVIAKYLQAGNKVTYIVPNSRVKPIVTWLKASMKKGLPIEEIQKHKDWEELRGYFRSCLESAANFDAGIITIRAKTGNNLVSKALADAAGNTLVERNLESLKAKVYRLKDFVGSQTAERKKILDELENRRVSLQKKHEVGNTTEFRSDIYRRYSDSQRRLGEITRALDINKKILAHTTQELNKIKENITNPKLSGSDLFLTQNQHRMELLQYQRALLESDTTPEGESKKAELQKELDETAQNLQNAMNQADQAGGLTFISPSEYYKDLENTALKLRDERRKLETENSTLVSTLSTDKQEISKIPNILQEFEQLQRQITVSSELYLGLQQKLQEIEIMEAGIANDIKIVGEPDAPGQPIGLPLMTRIIASLIGGLLFAFIILILKNTFIHTVRNYRELQDEGVTVIGEVPVFSGLNPPMASFLGKNLDRIIGQNVGSFTEKISRFAPKIVRRIQGMAPNVVADQIDKVMPHLSKLQNKLGLKQRERVCELVVIDKPNSSEADIFRYMRLRLNAYASQTLTNVPPGKGKVIMITSPTESVGKTFISTNLAASFGKGEIKTLLIDLDLRNSSVNRTFKDFKGVPGIETAVKTKTPLEDYIISVTKFFDVLLCRPGIDNPTDILESQQMRNFIEKMRDKYDYIFIDSAPALIVCDPSLVAPVVDMILLVAAFEVTFREDIALTIEGLNAGKSHPLVGVLNLVDSGFDRYGYGYGYGYGKKAG